MTAVDIASPAIEIPRDRWGRPLVVPPTGGKPIPYVRCTTFVDCLEDKFNLQKWMQRMVALGLAESKDLLLAIAAHRDDKKQLDGICEQALERAKSKSGATIGTALHALTEQHDRGLPIGSLPDDARADLDAYIAKTAKFTHLGIEEFVVHDGFKIGGTFDRLVSYQGQTYIADLKTGSIDFGIGKIAMQLAVYAHSVRYDHQTRQRRPIEGVDRERAIVIHLPAGEARCELVWVDIRAGWEAVQIARAVRSWRARTDLSTPLVDTDDDPLLTAISVAATVDELTNLWRDNATDWTPAHTSAATERKRHLHEKETA